MLLWRASNARPYETESFCLFSVGFLSVCKFHLSTVGVGALDDPFSVGFLSVCKFHPSTVGVGALDDPFSVGFLSVCKFHPSTVGVGALDDPFSFRCTSVVGKWFTSHRNISFSRSGTSSPLRNRAFLFIPCWFSLCLQISPVHGRGRRPRRPVFCWFSLCLQISPVHGRVGALDDPFSVGFLSVCKFHPSTVGVGALDDPFSVGFRSVCKFHPSTVGVGALDDPFSFRCTSVVGKWFTSHRDISFSRSGTSSPLRFDVGRLFPVGFLSVCKFHPSTVGVGALDDPFSFRCTSVVGEWFTSHRNTLHTVRCNNTYRTFFRSAPADRRLGERRYPP